LEKKQWYSQSIEDVLNKLDSNKKRLAEEEAKKRLNEFSLNELKEERKPFLKNLSINSRIFLS